MIEDLLPESLKTLRELYRTVYRDRVVLLLSLETILDDLEDVWENQGTYTETAEKLDREVLPLLRMAADLPLDQPSESEAAIAHVLLEWRRVSRTLRHP